MKKLSHFWLALATFLVGSSAQALVSPLGVSILSPVEFPPRDFDVFGARLNLLWGEHRSMTGIDVGALASVSDGSFAGIGVSGLLNYNKGTATIVLLQLAGAANINVNKARIFGLQVAAGLNSNVAESTAVGIQIAGLGNHSPYTRVYGLQVGLYNSAREVYGFQFGLFNSTDVLHGIQIGLVNFNKQGLFYMAPLMNIGF